MNDETRMLVSIAEQAELAKLRLDELIASVKPQLAELRLRQLIASINEYLALAK